MLPQFKYARPASLKEALGTLDGGGAVVHAGGTDLIGCLREEVFAADRVVSLSALPELRGIESTSNGGLRIGAMTTLAEIADNGLIHERYAALADSAAVVGSPQLRNQGTVGGNLCQKPRCWYYRGDFNCLRKGGEMCFAYEGENQYHCVFGGESCFIVHPSDTAPALIALGAVVRIGGGGSSRSLLVEQLHTPPSKDPMRELELASGEVVTDVILPAPKSNSRSSYRKVRARASWDFALASVALNLRFDGATVVEANVVLGGVAPVPWRARLCETALTGSELSDLTIENAARASVHGAEPLAHNAYKVDLVEGLVTDQLQAINRAQAMKGPKRA